MADLAYSTADDKTADGKAAPAEKKPETDDLASEHGLAMKRWDRAVEKDKENRDAAYEDVAFQAGIGQWTDEALKLRKGRPCMMFNDLPKFMRQITGDIRQMRPSIKVVGVDDRADAKVADINGGLIRYIENRSDAQHAYFQGADSQVAAGIGHWRIIRERTTDTTFDQELRIVGIKDGIFVVCDDDAVLPNKEDAKFWFIPVDLSREAYEERWPGKAVSEFGDAAAAAGWCGSDFVRVAEYWVKKPFERLLALMPDGSIDDLTDDATGKAVAYKAKGIRVEKRPSHRVCRYLMNAKEFLEGPVEWPGIFIPIVRVVGEEIQIGKKTVRFGKVRFAKDAQRLRNYTRSTQAEVIALQPKAPWIGTEKNFEKSEDEWAQANDTPFPYLTYTPDPLNSGVPPQRVQPPVSSQGLSELAAVAVDDMKGVMGLFDASLGARSNETSGKAIIARQREGDVGSFVYVDNFSRAIKYTGKILLDLIPHVYDTERTVRVLGEDGKEQVVRINQAMPGDGTPETERVMNDVTVGAYDVVLETGPSYTTKRQEAAEGMMQLVQAVPAVAPLIIDKLAKALDWNDAENIAKRAETLLPPEIRAREAKERGEPLEEAQPNPAQQLEAQRMQGELEKLRLDVEGKNLDNQRRQIELAGATAKSAQAAMPTPGEPAVDPVEGMVAHERAQADIVKARSDAAVATINERIAAIKLQMAEIDLAKALAPPPAPDTLSAEGGPLPGPAA